MAYWHYYDNEGRKQGPYSDGQIQQLAQQGTIIPETVLEIEGGKTLPAKKVKGLTFAETTRTSLIPPEPNPFTAPAPVPADPFTAPAPVPADPFTYPLAQSTPSAPPSPPAPASAPPPDQKTLFCTNCGNSISDQAVACMSCGARPTGHKKFCRQCGVSLNPEQIICTKCEAKIASDNLASSLMEKVKRAVPPDAATSLSEAIKRNPRPLVYTGITTAVILFLICIVFSGGGNSPSAVTRTFIAAVEKRDMATVGKVTTPEGAEFAAIAGDLLRAKLAQAGKITKVRHTISENTAKTYVTFKNESEQAIFDLVKKSGKWKVHFEPPKSQERPPFESPYQR